MDRNISYAGQVPRALDFLRTGQFTMVGLAKLAEAMLGTSTVVSQGGFAVTPGGGLNIAVGPGQIYQLQSIEPTSLSALNADGRQVLKQGVALDAQTLTLAPPTAVGYAQSFLIQAAYADVPDGKIVLSYQNPTPVLDPSTGALKYVTYPGPGGSGDQQYTILHGGVVLSPKPGAAAPAGQQTIPAPDVGYVGLYVVTLAYGATSIAGGNIAPYAGAPFIPLSLVQVAAREIATVQSAGLPLNGADPTEMAQAMARGIWVDNLTGTGDLAVATLGVVLPSLLKGMRIGGNATATSTVTNPKLRVVNLGTLGGYTDFPILKGDGSALAAGDIKSGRIYRYEADGAGNVLISGGGLSSVPVVSGNGFTIVPIVGVTAFLTAAQAIPNNTETAVVLPTPQVSVTGAYNAGSPSKIFIPAGVKKFRTFFSGCFEANSSGFRKGRILLNGTPPFTPGTGGAEGMGMAADTKGPISSDVTFISSGGAIVDLTTLGLSPDGTNYLQFLVTQTSGGALNLRQGNTGVCVEFLG